MAGVKLSIVTLTFYVHCQLANELLVVPDAFTLAFFHNITDNCAKAKEVVIDKKILLLEVLV